MKEGEEVSEVSEEPSRQRGDRPGRLQLLQIIKVFYVYLRHSELQLPSLLARDDVFLLGLIPFVGCSRPPHLLLTQRPRLSLSV